MPAPDTNYDSITSTYLAHTEREDSWNNLYERPALLEMMGEIRNKDVVDVGCGSGFYSKFALGGNCRVTAVDASEAMLSHVTNTLDSTNLSTAAADIANGLPFIKNNSQDTIICSLVLHYIENWDTALKDFHRVLKPGGDIYISTHHPLSDYLVLDKDGYFDSRFYNDTWGTEHTPFKVRFYTRTMSEVLTPILNSPLHLEEFREPKPNEACRAKSPKTYDKLTQRPGFLFLKLRKQEASD